MAKLYFYYSSMNAGKSTTLLQADFNYRERGMETMLWTAAIDDRYDPGIITSRIGLQGEANRFGPNTDLRLEIEKERSTQAKANKNRQQFELDQYRADTRREALEKLTDIHDMIERTKLDLSRHRERERHRYLSSC